jgi:hypothetical protein
VTLLAETWSGLLQRDDTVFRSEVVRLCRQFGSGVGLDADHPRLDEIAGVG